MALLQRLVYPSRSDKQVSLEKSEAQLVAREAIQRLEDTRSQWPQIQARVDALRYIRYNWRIER